MYVMFYRSPVRAPESTTDGFRALGSTLPLKMYLLFC